MIGSDVKIENISKSFGSFKALKGVGFEIKKGEFFSLLGPSGCGKTTLLRIIAGFENPDSGSIYLDDRSVLDLPPNKRPVNTIFQSYALFPHLSVFENVAFSLRLKKLPEKEIRARVDKYLELVKLQDHARKFPAQMSGGQRQRVAIARALINDPQVLLLDEPLSALDAKLRQHMLIELDAIHDAIGITFIYVTHDQQEALSVSDRIAVMKDGEVLQIGTPSDIYESPATSFVADFIGETNFLEGTVVAVEGQYAQIEVSGIGMIKIEMDKPVVVGDYVKTTIRPEKIKITKEKPKNTTGTLNILPVVVDERIYTGFHTKYYVKVENSPLLFRVFKQHIQYFSKERVISWKEKVHISWNADDGFIVEVHKKQ